MKLIAVASLPLLCLLLIGCAPAPDLDAHLNSIAKPHRFSLLRWESRTVLHGLNQWLFGEHKKIDSGVQIVTEYFATVEQIKNLKSNGNQASSEAELKSLYGRKIALEDAVEGILARQIKETLGEQGIFNPMNIRLRVTFPPPNFKLEKPPHLLVVSPRDKIESIKRVLLKQDLSVKEMEAIETEVDKLGVSSLVLELGGLGATYPTFVTNDASLRFILDTATEEWLHQYLAFKPLGFHYILDLIGVSRNYEIVTMNETVAGMVSGEIGAAVYQKYYSGYENSHHQNQVEKSDFDFNREMREIRRAVDRYLAQGEIEQAEEFMEQKRQYLATKGYYIRKLNQAYFAFHGAYADRLTSIDPIGVELRQLRNQSASLKDFLNVVAKMTSRQELRESIK